MKIKYLFLLIFTITLIGCEKDDDVKYQRQSYDINEKSNDFNEDIISFSTDNYNNSGNNNYNNTNALPPSGDNIFNENLEEDESNSDDNNENNESTKSAAEIENENANNVPEEPIVEITPSSLLDSFTTNILTTDSNRYNNIKIVSDRLNGHILNPRRNFFF